MKVIVLLAGKGTRFLPLSETVAKPLIRVGGSSVLAHILASLKQLDFEELILVTGYLSDQIETYVNEVYHGPTHIIKQDTLNGTGGAVYAAKDHIDCPVLIIFGDTIFDADLSVLNQGDTGNMIWTRSVEDYQRFGIAQTDQNGNLARIVEKPQEDVGRHANIGLYYIKDHEALRAGLEHIMAGPSVRGEFFITYALNHMVELGRKIQVSDVEGWHDCGTLDALIATNEYLLTRPNAGSTLQDMAGVTVVPPVRIHRTARLHDCQIGPNVTIGAGSSVTSSTIVHSIVDRNCDLKDVVMSGSLVGNDQSLSDLEIHGCIAANGKVTEAP